MMSEGDNAGKKKNNYKLLVDPELQKGKKKVYRLNGAILGKPPIPDPQDPRVQKTLLGVTGNDVQLTLPRFKCDKFWVEAPPKRDVLITGLPETFQGPVLREECESVGSIHSIRFHKHPKTKLFIGAVTVSYIKAGAGVKAVELLNDSIVGGCQLKVVVDDKDEHLKAHLDRLLHKDRRSSVDGKVGHHTNKSVANDKPPPAHTSNNIDSKTTPSSTNDKRQQMSVGQQKMYPYSSLTLLGTNSTPSVGDSPSSGGGCFSPGLTPCTPTSIDSGIGMRSITDTSIGMRPSFDPLLALRSSLGKSATKTQPPLPTSCLPPLPPEEQPIPPPPPTKDKANNLASSKEVSKLGDILSPVSLPSPVSNTHSPLGNGKLKQEFDFEEISGDESPVMVYSTQLEVEAISSDEDIIDGGGGEDMEISDEDTIRDNMIEVNVKQVTGKEYVPHVPYHPHMGVVHPSPNYPPPLPPPMDYYQPGPHPPEYPPPPIPPPPPCPKKKKETIFTPSRQWKVPIAHTEKEQCGQMVLYRALEQLALILCKDVDRKLVESSAFPVLDAYWEKRDKEKQTQPETTQAEGEPEVKPMEPYRRMLPGLVPKTRETLDSEDTPITPRKRLMNFKIPLVDRGSQRRDTVIVSRRRLYEDENESDTRRGRRKRHRSRDRSPRSRDRHKRHQLKNNVRLAPPLSDISSDELYSDRERKETTRDKKALKSGPRTPQTTEEEEEEEEEEEKTTELETEWQEVFGTTTSSEDDFKPPTRKRKLSTSARKELTELEVETKVGIAPVDVTPIDVTMVTETEVHAKEAPKLKMFPPRLPRADEVLLESFHDGGPDKEDVAMFKLAFARLKGEESDLVTNIPWAHYPPAVSDPPPPKYHKFWEDRTLIHRTGCARAEGYYKIDAQDKTAYLPHLRRSKVNATNESQEKLPKSSGRGNRLNHRRVASLFTSGDVSRELQQYNQLKNRKKHLRFAKSTIHNWGLFALENIPADEMVIEYVGQVVRQVVADDRERRYEAQGIGSSYLFRVDHDYIIDATKSGNMARFINHCCDPNCYAKVINIGNHKKIVIYSKRDIQPGEEITYDYKFPIEEEKITCLCGAPNCRGTLN